MLKGLFFVQNKNIWTVIKILFKFVPKHPIDNDSSMVYVTAWHRTGDKPWPEPMMTQFTDLYMFHPASMS